jgi:Zn-finger nucleic acid-binding protein
LNRCKMRNDNICPNCGVEVGQTHIPHCDIEHCPIYEND